MKTEKMNSNILEVDVSDKRGKWLPAVPGAAFSNNRGDLANVDARGYGKKHADLRNMFCKTLFILAITFSILLMCSAIAQASAGGEYSVHFISYGSDVPMQTIIPGEFATKPALDPTRKNYTFNYWTTTPGGSGKEFDFDNTPVNDNLFLYASWSGVPNSVTYKVVWWLENPDLGVPSIPYTAAHYEYADETRTGTPGTYVSVNSLPTLFYNPDGTIPSVYIENPLYYADFQSSAPTVVSGAGNTIVNVFLTRKVYRIKFDLLGSSRWLKMNGADDTYYGSDYYIDVKYEQNITDIWPSSMTATFSSNLPDTLPFRSWMTPAGTVVNVPGQQSWLSRRNVMNAEMMPRDPTLPGYTLAASYFAIDPLSVRYWIEALPGHPIAGEISRSFTTFEGVTKTYIVDRQYDQDNVSDNFSAKAIQGTQNVGRDYSDTETGQGSSVRGSLTIQNFYYDRNKHNFIYDMGGSTTSIPTVSDLMYGQPLTAYRPSPDPVRPGYVFKGWYKDSWYTMEFDFNNKTMPANTDLAVFAKWESTDHTVYFYDEENLLGVQGVGDAEPVNFNSLMFDGVIYDANLYDPVKGTFAGWLYYPQGTDVLSPYLDDLLVYGDLNLYARWEAPGHPVFVNLTFYGNGGTNKLYPNYAVTRIVRSDQTLLLSIVSPNGLEMFTRPGFSFGGWTLTQDYDAPVVSDVVIGYSDVRVYAKWVKENDVELVFHGNGGFNRHTPPGDEFIYNVLANYGDVALSYYQPYGDEMFYLTGYRLTGWSLMPTGSIVTTVNIGTATPIHIYAIWEKVDPVTLTFYGNSGSNNLTPNDRVVRDVEVNQILELIPPLTPTGDEAFVRNGFIFDGWVISADTLAPVITSIVIYEDNISLYAKWISEEDITLTFDGNGGMNRTLSYATKIVRDVEANQTLVLIPPLTPQYDEMFWRVGYSFRGWGLTTDSTIDDIITNVEILEEDVIVYAVWQKINEVMLTFDGNGGTNNLTPNDRVVRDVEANQILLLEPPLTPTGDEVFVRPGFIFDGWAIGADPLAPVIMTIEIYEDDVSLYAKWISEEDITLTFDGNGGMNRMDPPAATVVRDVYKNQILLLVPPITPTGDEMFWRAGYYFIGWGIDENTPIILTSVEILEEDVTVYAIWGKVDDDVTLTFNGNGGTYWIDPYYNTIYTVSIPSNMGPILLSDIQPVGNYMFQWPGYKFIGWAATPTGTPITTVYIGSDDMTVYAIWMQTITGITVKTQPALTYSAGDVLDLSTLVVTCINNDSTTVDVEFANFVANGLKVSLADGTLLTAGHNGNPITITHTTSGYTTQTDPLIVSAIPSVLDSIAVTTMPTKTVYTEGDALDLAGLIVTATYSDGSSKIVTDYVTSPYEGALLNDVGTQTVTVGYVEGGITKLTTFTITVNTNVVLLESIAVTTIPTKTIYTESDALDLSGLIITATYSNGSSKTVTGYVTSPYEGAPLNDVGTQIVTVGYVEGGITKLTNFTIEVNSKLIVLDSIAVTTIPTKTIYTESDALDLSGLIITATYSNGSSKTVTGYVTSPYEGAPLNDVGTQIVTVGYVEGGITKLTNFTIAVNSKLIVLDSIAVTVMPTKTVYTEGEALDLSGLVVAARYSDGSSKNATGYVTSPYEGAPLNGVGTQIVTVGYAEEGITKLTTFTITVNAKSVVLDSIAVVTMPTKTVYTEGEAFDPSGLVVAATYNDGSSKIVTGYITYPANSIPLIYIGTQTVTVSYTEDGINRLTIFTVTVNAKNIPPEQTDYEFLLERAADIRRTGINKENLQLEDNVLTLVIDGREFILSTNANNRNIKGEIYLGDGYYLVFELNGNGSNVKEFSIIKR